MVEKLPNNFEAMNTENSFKDALELMRIAMFMLFNITAKLLPAPEDIEEPK